MVMPAAPTAALIKIQSEFLTEPGLIAGKRASVTGRGIEQMGLLAGCDPAHVVDADRDVQVNQIKTRI